MRTNPAPAITLPLSPMVALTGVYVCTFMGATEEDIRIFDMVADSAYAAIGNAMVLARPGKDDLLIVAWINAEGEFREMSVKVMSYK